MDIHKYMHIYVYMYVTRNICVINDGGEFGRSFCGIYPKELELKVEHQGDHFMFSNLDITKKEGTFIYKLLFKRDAFLFSVVRMPHIESNIPQNSFYYSNQR